MPISDEFLSEISVMVAGGFADRDQIVDTICQWIMDEAETNEEDSVWDGEDFDPSEVEMAVDEAIARKQTSQLTWPAVTDFDRLTQAFNAINRRNILAIHNAGFDQSDGYETFQEESQRQSPPVTGYCFYHSQDMQRAIEGGGLFLAFGPSDPDLEDTVGPKVGTIIVEELQKSGLKVEWAGSFRQRIYLPDFDWKRR